MNVRAVGLVTGERRRVVRCGGNVSAGERFLPKTFHSEWTNIDLDPKCLAFLPPSQVDKKRSKVRKMKWVLEAERGRRGNNSFRSFPPSSTPGAGRVGEGRGWGILGCGLVTQWWLPCKGDTTARGGATQPDSSLNCQGLAASSWCEGLECGRPRLAGPPPGPPRPHSAKVNSFCSAPDVLNMSHCHTFLPPVAKFSGSATQRHDPDD